MDHKLSGVYGVCGPRWFGINYQLGSGVAAMGMEKIDFIWYLKKITWLALLGYFAGIVAYLLVYPIFAVN